MNDDKEIRKIKKDISKIKNILGIHDNPRQPLPVLTPYPHRSPIKHIRDRK